MTGLLVTFRSPSGEVTSQLLKFDNCEGSRSCTKAGIAERAIMHAYFNTHYDVKITYIENIS
jgi:hypothetical protein